MGAEERNQQPPITFTANKSVFDAIPLVIVEGKP